MKCTINFTHPILKPKLHYRVKFGRFTTAVYNNTDDVRNVNKAAAEKVFQTIK